MAILKNTVIDDTGYLKLPNGTIGQRPGTPTDGHIRFNTSQNTLEVYDGNKWIEVTKEFTNVGITLHLDASNTNSYSGTGTQWTDLSGNGYHANNVGATFNTSPSRFTFDGTNDYMYLSSINYGTIKLTEFSIFVWMKTSYTGTVYNENWSLFDFDRSETISFYIHGTSGKVAFSGKDGTNDYFDIEGNTAYNDGNWHYVGMTYSKRDGKIKLYADGNLDREFTYTLGEIGTGGINRYGFIGDGSEADTENGTRNEEYFTGDISMVHFYENKVLTPKEVRSNYNYTKGIFE